MPSRRTCNDILSQTTAKSLSMEGCDLRHACLQGRILATDTTMIYDTRLLALGRSAL